MSSSQNRPGTPLALGGKATKNKPLFLWSMAAREMEEQRTRHIENPMSDALKQREHRQLLESIRIREESFAALPDVLPQLDETYFPRGSGTWRNREALRAPAIR